LRIHRKEYLKSYIALKEPKKYKYEKKYCPIPLKEFYMSTEKTFPRTFSQVSNTNRSVSRFFFLRYHTGISHSEQNIPCMRKHLYSSVYKKMRQVGNS